MISKTLSTALFAFAVLQVAVARLYCDCEVEYAGQDPEFMLTEVRRSVYKEYETVRIEVEKTDCGGDVAAERCVQRRSLLDELDAARFELDDYLGELNGSIMRRLKAAYREYGGTSGPDYTRLMADIWAETETQLRPYLTAFREHVSRPRSFLGGVLGGVQSMFSGIVGGRSPL